MISGTRLRFFLVEGPDWPCTVRERSCPKFHTQRTGLKVPHLLLKISSISAAYKLVKRRSLVRGENGNIREKFAAVKLRMVAYTELLFGDSGGLDSCQQEHHTKLLHSCAMSHAKVDIRGFHRIEVAYRSYVGVTDVGALCVAPQLSVKQ